MKQQSPPNRHRRHVRVSHLTTALVLKRMRQGQFTPREIREVSGLREDSVLNLVRTFEHHGVITYLGKTKDVGPTGRREHLYQEVR